MSEESLFFAFHRHCSKSSLLLTMNRSLCKWLKITFHYNEVTLKDQSQAFVFFCLTSKEIKTVFKVRCRANKSIWATSRCQLL